MPQRINLLCTNSLEDCTGIFGAKAMIKYKTNGYRRTCSVLLGYYATCATQIMTGMSLM